MQIDYKRPYVCVGNNSIMYLDNLEIAGKLDALVYIFERLNNIRRFCGKSISVTAHSYTVYTLAKLTSCNRETQLYALLHDISEVVVNDIPSPIKDAIEAESKVNSVVNRVENKFVNEYLDLMEIDTKLINYVKVHELDTLAWYLECQYLLPDVNSNILNNPYNAHRSRLYSLYKSIIPDSLAGYLRLALIEDDELFAIFDMYTG